MGTYQFVVVHHGDIVLDHPVEPQNFGYNSTIRHPILSWVYHAFATGENLYTKLFAPIEDDYSTDFDFQLDDPLEDAIDLVSRLPLERESLVSERGWWGVDRFYAGDNTTEYKWTIDGSDRLILHRQAVDGPILMLGPAQHEIFARDYAEFLMTTERLGAYRVRGRGIIRELQGATVPS